MLFADLFNQVNPQDMGTMATYLLQAAQPSTQPQSTGQALLGGVSAIQAQQQRQQLQDLLKKSMTGGQNDQNAQNGNFSQAFNVNSPGSSETFGINLPTTQPAMLAALKDQAAQTYPNSPVMQQVAITQALQEGGLLGKPSQLAQQGNLFGIKAPGTAGSINMPTTEYASGQPQQLNANFGANKSIGDSFNQYRNLLNNPRYAKVADAQNPQAAFSALQQAGYATDPEYARKLGRVYNQYVAPLYM